MEFQYKGLKAALERVEVTDTEIDRHLEKLRQQASMEQPDKEPYALDDAFAREVGQCENLAQMRERMGEALRAHYDERAGGRDVGLHPHRGRGGRRCPKAA